jgi:hypothetical protein
MRIELNRIFIRKSGRHKDQEWGGGGEGYEITVTPIVNSL